MQQKLNSFKVYQEKGILIIVWVLIGLFFMLLPMVWWIPQEEAKAESEIDLSALIYDEDGNCIWWIWCTKEEREPWMLNESWDAQLMPPIEKETEHERFKELAYAYSLDPSKFRIVENHYWIKEWVILCITIAETSWGWRGYAKTNPGNVGNNDRGQRVQYAFFETGLEKIGQTLTNSYLGKKKTLGCLSNAGNCTEIYDNGKRYATSDWNRERNMKACLSVIYWQIDPSTFSIRR